MSFRQRNTYFLHQAIDVGMKGLSEEMRLEKYCAFKYGNVTIKEDIHDRLRAYYSEEGDKLDFSTFYEEVAILIGFYDGDYLINNLIHENRIVEIVNHLVISKNLGFIRVSDPISRAGKFMTHLKLISENKKTYTKGDFDKYFLLELNMIIDSTKEKGLIKDSTSLAKEYSKWVVNNLGNTKDCVSSYPVFLVGWHILVPRGSSREAILLLHSFIDAYRKEMPQGLFKFLVSCMTIYNSLFVSIDFFPLLDVKDVVDFGSGYRNKRNEFIQLMDKSRSIDLLNKENSFKELFKILENTTDEDIKAGIQKILETKVNNKHSITSEEIEDIFNTKFSEIIEKLKIKIMKRFYLFEFCDSLDVLKKKTELLASENRDYTDEAHYTSFRLISAASHFGVGLNSLIEFLKSKNVDSKFLSAQSRLTDEVLLLIKGKFQKDVNIESQQNILKYERYSDKDLLEFKSHIQKRIQEAKKELKSLEEQIDEKDIVRLTDFSNKKFKISKSNSNFGKDHLRNMSKRQSDFIHKLDEALSRIENKTYGVCRVTGKLISKERLIALPHVTLSIEAKKS